MYINGARTWTLSKIIVTTHNMRMMTQWCDLKILVFLRPSFVIQISKKIDIYALSIVLLFLCSLVFKGM